MLAIVFNDGSIIIAKLYNITVTNTLQYHNQTHITFTSTNPIPVLLQNIQKLITSFPKVWKIIIFFVCWSVFFICVCVSILHTFVCVFTYVCVRFYIRLCAFLHNLCTFVREFVCVCLISFTCVCMRFTWVCVYFNLHSCTFMMG